MQCGARKLVQGKQGVNRGEVHSTPKVWLLRNSLRNCYPLRFSLSPGLVSRIRNTYRHSDVENLMAKRQHYVIHRRVSFLEDRDTVRFANICVRKFTNITVIDLLTRNKHIY
jgi:hypothetical protein